MQYLILSCMEPDLLSKISVIFQHMIRDILLGLKAIKALSFGHLFYE